jgi:hypothetical protein
MPPPVQPGDGPGSDPGQTRLWPQVPMP